MIARGNCVSDTSGAVHAGSDAMIAGACRLPEGDQQMYHVTLYYKEGDGESKSLFEAWQKNDTLRVIADPFIPQMPNTFGKFQAVCVTDPTQQDLVTANKVSRTPCVVIMSPNEPPEGMAKNTVLARVEGYNGDIEKYADHLLKAFRGGIQAVQSGSVQSASGWSYPPKIKPPPKVNDESVQPQAGFLDPQIIIPESLADSVDSLGTRFLQGIYILVGAAVILFGILPLVLRGLPCLWKGWIKTFTWYRSWLLQTSAKVNPTPAADALTLQTLLAKIEQLEKGAKKN